jgi:cytochrome c-type biogenesis protein CcmH/NrfG
VVNGSRGWIDAVWPAVLLVCFLATFRTTERESAPDEVSSHCAGPHASDVATLEQCLALDPQNVELMTDLGDQYVAQHAAERAEEWYRRALTVDPRDGDVHLRLGELLLARGDAAAALKEAEAALKFQPGSLTAEDLIERASGRKDRS